MVETLEVKHVLSWARASTAKTRSRAASDLRTKPCAPAFKTSRTICSDSCRVRISTLASGFVFKDLPGRFKPVQARHSNVKNDNIGFQLLCLLYRVTAVPRLAANLPLRLGVQKRHQTHAYHFIDHRPRRFAVSSLITSTGSWWLRRVQQLLWPGLSSEGCTCAGRLR